MLLEVAILEDELAQSQLIESWLLPENYNCHTYATGQSLLDALTTASFDLLLVDWELPDINGPDVMNTVRNEMKIDTPIIFITSRDSEEDIVKALTSGADDYLVKPVRQFEFLARVKANTKRSLTLPQTQHRQITHPIHSILLISKRLFTKMLSNYQVKNLSSLFIFFRI